MAEKETCPVCGKYGYSFLHSCPGVPQTPELARAAAKARLSVATTASECAEACTCDYSTVPITVDADCPIDGNQEER